MEPQKEIEQLNKVKDLLKTSSQSATFQFFAIFEKGKPTRVLPALLNLKYMNMAEMNNIRLGEALVSSIKIPTEPKPWSEISDKADLIFLALQSRQDWGEVLTKDTNLLKVEKVREEVERIEESLQNFTWREDYFSGKFNTSAVESEEVKEINSEEKQSNEEGINPGGGWKA